MFIWGASDFVFIGRYDQDKEKKQEAEFKSKYPYTWEAEMEETTEEEKVYVECLFYDIVEQQSHFQVLICVTCTKIIFEQILAKRQDTSL